VVATLVEHTWYNYGIGFPLADPWREVFNSSDYDREPACVVRKLQRTGVAESFLNPKDTALRGSQVVAWTAMLRSSLTSCRIYAYPPSLHPSSPARQIKPLAIKTAKCISSFGNANEQPDSVLNM
jgi:hypothetical protein